MSTPILAHAADWIEYIPVIFLVGAAVVIRAALKDGRKKNASAPTVPTSPVGRQVRSTLDRQRRDSSRTSATAGFRALLASTQHDGREAGRES